MQWTTRFSGQQYRLTHKYECPENSVVHFMYNITALSQEVVVQNFNVGGVWLSVCLLLFTLFFR